MVDAKNTLRMPYHIANNDPVTYHKDLLGPADH